MPVDHPLYAPLRTLLVTAGEYALERRKAARSSRKVDGSLVTDVDQALDEQIAKDLGRLYPLAGLKGEEGTHKPSQGSDTFYIDPIDGTDSYMQDMAYWGPTVTLVRDGQLEAGGLYLPRLRQFWFAARGKGAWCDDRRLQLPEPPDPHQQVLFAPSRFHQAPKGLWPGKLRVLGCAAAHLALVAGGSGHVALIPRWSIWDVGCGALLVTEAGGRLSDTQGHAVDVIGGPLGLPFVAGAPTALERMVSAFAQHQREN